MKVGLSLVHCEKMANRSSTYRKLQAFDQTGSEKILKPEVKKYFSGKLVKNYFKTSILVF